MSDATARLKVLMGAPDESHPDWPKVRHTMSQILGDVEALTSRVTAAQWVVAPLRQIAAPVPAGAIEPLGTLPSRGCITHYPVFAALATQPIASQADVARKMQALYLISVALREYYIVQKEYGPPINSAELSCRRIVRGRFSDERIGAIIRRSSSPSSLCNQLLALQHSKRPLSNKDGAIVSYLLPLLRDVRDERDPRNKDGIQKKGGTETAVHIDASDDEPTSRKQALKHVRPDEESRAEMLSEGLCPEYETTRETLYAETPPSRNKDFPARQLSETQAQQRLILRARAYKTNQQQVPNRRDMLHAPALAPLLHPCGPASPPKGADLDWMLDTLLGFMLLTGCKDEDLIDVRVWGTRSEVPSQPPALGVVLQYAEFMGPVARLPDSWHPDSEYRHHFRRPANRLFLEIPTHLPIGERIVELASRVPKGGLLCGDFLGSTDELRKKLQGRVSNLNDTHHTHLTLNRISLFLWGAIYALDGDMAEALLLSNRHRRSNDPRLYYYSTQNDQLRHQYGRLWNAKSKRPKPNDTRRHAVLKSLNPDIGSAAVPYRDSISDLVRTMKERISCHMAGRGRRTASRWIEIHNSLTAYVICQMQWLTGIRAVRDPIELPLYAARSGFLGVIDKDSNDEYGARVVWLIEPVQQQIEIYLHYVDSATRSIFEKMNREAAFRFIGEGPVILQVNQQQLGQHLPDYPFAPNSHRHYLRTRLREKGVDGGIVDAWMGHGGIGAEPYARHSAMSPVTMREGAEAALNSIWEELGWEVLPGSRR